MYIGQANTISLSHMMMTTHEAITHVRVGTGLALVLLVQLLLVDDVLVPDVLAQREHLAEPDSLVVLERLLDRQVLDRALHDRSDVIYMLCNHRVSM